MNKSEEEERGERIKKLMNYFSGFNLELLAGSNIITVFEKA